MGIRKGRALTPRPFAPVMEDGCCGQDVEDKGVSLGGLWNVFPGFGQAAFRHRRVVDILFAGFGQRAFLYRRVVDILFAGFGQRAFRDRRVVDILFAGFGQRAFLYWAIRAGLLTPFTFARHRLSPLAAFTSGAYFLHNGRR